MARIVLASGSPRRQELLTRIGIRDFTVRVPQVEEWYPQGLTPPEIVSYISREKSQAVPSEEDYKSVFVFNIAVSVLLYLLLVGAMPWIARFYGMPELVRISRLSATANTVQGILFSKNVSRYWNRPIPFTGFTATTAVFFAMIAIRLVIQWLFSVSLLSLRTKIGQTARKNNNALKNEMVTCV